MKENPIKYTNEWYEHAWSSTKQTFLSKKPDKDFDFGWFSVKQTNIHDECISIKPNERYDHVWLMLKKTPNQDGCLSRNQLKDKIKDDYRWNKQLSSMDVYLRNRMIDITNGDARWNGRLFKYTKFPQNPNESYDHVRLSIEQKINHDWCTRKKNRWLVCSWVIGDDANDRLPWISIHKTIWLKWPWLIIDATNDWSRWMSFHRPNHWYDDGWLSMT